jgi:methanethiol oxidase
MEGGHHAQDNRSHLYRTPGDAIVAAPEALAYAAACHPQGAAKDAIAVLDCDAASPSYGGLAA